MEPPSPQHVLSLPPTPLVLDYALRASRLRLPAIALRMLLGQWRILLLSAVFALFGYAATRPHPLAAGGVPLALNVPRPAYYGTPPNPGTAPNLEPQSWRPRVLPMVPRATFNLARGKPVSSSDDPPFMGDHSLLTDGDNVALGESTLELFPGLQWVQIDLQAACPIEAVVIWRELGPVFITLDVVVQVSDDPTFATNVTTLFNNDHDNTSGLGAGKDLAYVESHEGKLIPAHGVRARYVRLYSNGTTRDLTNPYVEVEVHGHVQTPAKPAAAG